jgi:outer membrane protein OmpA-like peptidoglycan-associated protein
MKKFIILLLSLFVFQNAYAGDLNFETTAEGITKALTKPKTEQTIKTRGLKEFSDTKTRSIKVVGKEQGKIVEKTITVSENQPIQGVNLKIEFDVNSYTVRSDSLSLLDELGKALTGDKLKEKHLVIKGHTDSDGDNPYNLKLSLNRALAVKSYLTSNFSISSTQLKVFGYGEGVPLVPNTNKINKQINRRVEISATP